MRGKIINKKNVRRIKNILGLLAGNFLLAFSVNYFYIPNNIMNGGATGIALIMYRFFDINTSVTIFIINGCLLALGTFTVGKTFLFSTAFSSMLYPVFLGLLALTPISPPIIGDTMVRILCGGALAGTGIGLVIRSGGSTGGSDELAVILNKLTSYPVSTVMTLTDTAILLSGLFFLNLETVIYSIISMLIEIYSINRVMIAGKRKIQLFIITKAHEEVKRMLLDKAKAGVTLIRTESGYLGVESEAIMCIIHGRKLHKIEEDVYRIDAEAFITITEIKEVYGNGFSWERDKGAV